MDPKTKRLQELIEALIPLGENEKDLNFWAAIFNDLNPTEQETVLATLEEELRELKKLQ